MCCVLQYIYVCMDGVYRYLKDIITNNKSYVLQGNIIHGVTPHFDIRLKLDLRK